MGIRDGAVSISATSSALSRRWKTSIDMALCVRPPRATVRSLGRRESACLGSAFAPDMMHQVKN